MCLHAPYCHRQSLEIPRDPKLETTCGAVTSKAVLNLVPRSEPGVCASLLKPGQLTWPINQEALLLNSNDTCAMLTAKKDRCLLVTAGHLTWTRNIGGNNVDSTALGVTMTPV